MIDFVMIEPKKDQVLRIPKGASVLTVGNRDERNAALWFMYEKAKPPAPPPELKDLRIMVLPERSEIMPTTKLLGRFALYGSENYFVFEGEKDKEKEK